MTAKAFSHDSCNFSFDQNIINDPNSKSKGSLIQGLGPMFPLALTPLAVVHTIAWLTCQDPPLKMGYIDPLKLGYWSIESGIFGIPGPPLTRPSF